MANTTIDFEYLITNLDWDDGTDLEYTTTPFIFDRYHNFEHVYEKPGFYRIKGLVFKKSLNMINIFPTKQNDMSDEYVDKVLTSTDDNHDVNRLGLGSFDAVFSAGSKENYIDVDLLENISYNLEDTGQYELSPSFRSAANIRVSEEPNFKDSIEVEVLPYQSVDYPDGVAKSVDDGIRINIDVNMDPITYNYMTYDFDLWLPDFGRIGVSNQSTAFYITVVGVNPDENDNPNYQTTDVDQTLIRGNNEWQRITKTFIAPNPCVRLYIEITQANLIADRPGTISNGNDNSWKFYLKNLKIAFPNTKNQNNPAEWEKFESRIIVNPSRQYQSPTYDYNNFAMIGGLTKKSFNFKHLMRIGGYNYLTEEKLPRVSYDNYNEFDVINMLNTLSKYDSNLYDNYLNSYTGSIFDNNTLINNGYIDINQQGVFENTYISNTDIATTKLYTGVNPMWKQLGFDDDSYDIPNSNNYWDNIIPKEYSVLDRNGISKQAIEDPSKGSITPRTFGREEYVIDENSDQNWKNGFKWPVLPSVNKYSILSVDTGSDGHLVNQPDIKFFGSKKSWNGDDETSSITKLNDNDNNLIFNLSFEVDDNEDIEDLTNNFSVTQNTDFSVKLEKNRISKDTIDSFDSIDKSANRQAF